MAKMIAEDYGWWKPRYAHKYHWFVRVPEDGFQQHSLCKRHREAFEAGFAHARSQNPDNWEVLCFKCVQAYRAAYGTPSSEARLESDEPGSRPRMGTLNDPNLNYAANEPGEGDYTTNDDAGDGPSFTFYANNRHAVGVLTDYLGRFGSDGPSNSAHEMEVRKVIGDMEAWQLENPYGVKTFGTPGVDEPVKVHQDPHNAQDEANVAEAADRHSDEVQTESVTSDDVETGNVEVDPFPEKP